MADIRDLERLKGKVESLKSEVSHAKGARDEALRNLKEEFEVDSLDAAKALLKKLAREEEKVAADFDNALEAFNAKWAERLQG